MSPFAIPETLGGYWQDGFSLRAHLREFLQLSELELEQNLANGCQALAELGRRDFDWQDASAFYGNEQAGRLYLFDLAAWHLTSQQHIGDSLRIMADYAQGTVLDFGGGIGTHAIAAGLCPKVERVFYCDINPFLRQLVQQRVTQLGLGHKIICCAALPEATAIDTVLCFDVLEHLPDPSRQLLEFHRLLPPHGTLITNWYFFKGRQDEYPFHLDYQEQPALIARFFQTLQSHFLEKFHPYFTTSRCYVRA